MFRRPLIVLFSLLIVAQFGPATAIAADRDPLRSANSAGTPQVSAPVQGGFTTRGQTTMPYAPNILLVQFKSSAVAGTAIAGLKDKGDRVAGNAIGLKSIDTLAGGAGVTSVERPYIRVRHADKADRLGVDRWVMYRFENVQDLAGLAARFRADKSVQAVSFDWIAYPTAVPADPLYTDHWGHNNTAQLPGYDWGVSSHTLPGVGTPGFDTNAEAAWDGNQGYGASGIVIAILDTGVDVGHPDLRQVTGYDFGDDDSDPDDDSAKAGHGTACSGVAAAMNNSLGSVGIAADCSIMPLKIADSAGIQYFPAIQNALYYAADNGANVISMSFGATITSDPATDTALQYAYDAGVTLFAATGNDNASTIEYPAINPNVIAVGAASPCGDRKRSSSLSSELNPGVNTDPNGYTCDGERWWGSSYGVNTQDAADAVDIIAPTILPTTDIQGSGGYDTGDYSDFFNGTSCATPYAAGVAALILAKNPTFTPAEVRNAIVTSAQDVTNVESGSGWDQYSGYGMIDAAAAVGATPQIAKTLSGTIGLDTTLDAVGGRIYEVTGAVTVSAGVTLTIEPGVALKFDPYTSLNVQGTLLANGGSTPDSTIVFTSIKDDTAPAGAGEDSNGDGSATTPATGDWYYVQFDGATSSGSSMRGCEVRYTGQSNYSALYASNNAGPTIRDCDLRFGYRGLQIRTGAAPTVRNTAINDMTLVPVYMSMNSNPTFENFILDAPSGNGTDAIQLSDGAVVGTANLPRPSATIGGVPTHSLAYQVAQSITVDSGETLNIEPGVVLKFNLATNISNYGLLTALGGATSDSLIYFTSIDDDNAPAPLGQDTNVNGNNTFPDQNDWGGIRFFDSSDDNSILRNCQVLFAGYSSSTYGAVHCVNASPTLRNCDLTAAYYGVKCIGVSKPVLSNTSINAMQDVPVAIEISSDPVFDSVAFASTSDNGFDAIGILGGTLLGANTLRIRSATLGAVPIDNLVYILLTNVTVDDAGDLTIDPGIVVKPKLNTSLNVNGALHMDGTADPDSQIVFTSYKDDNVGNPADTNNDGSNTSPATGNWGRIRFNPGSTGSVTWSVLKFGGYSQDAIISVESASPLLSDLVLQNSYYGIRQAGTAASLITNVDVSNTTYTPMLMSISAEPVYTNISFTNVGLNAIGLIPETVGLDAVLRVRSMGGYSNISYYLAGDITVATGAHFRIEPGVVMKMGISHYDLKIDGSLQAQGAPDSTIAFTSVYDDSRGQPADTAGDGSATTPAASNWGRIWFNPTSVDSACVVQLCDLAYGGRSQYGSEARAVIWCRSASPTIRDNSFSTNYMGVWTDGNSAPLIQDNDFFNHSSTPLATSVVANPNYVGNTFNQNAIHAVGLINETLAADATLEKQVNMGLPSYPYYNLGTTTVGVGTTLTVEPGVLIKAKSNGDIFRVQGALMAAGTVGDRIILTTIKDDSQGGDSNVDGAATSPAAGDWYGIRFDDSSVDASCLIENALFRFGGRQQTIYMDSAGPTIRNNEFELCTYGLEMRNDSAPVIQDNLFRVITWYPILKSVLAQPVFSGNVLDNVNYPCIAIAGESIGQDMTMQKWDFAGFTNITQALAAGDLNVQLGATLTVAPGVVFKLFQQNGFPFQDAINVYGSLVADGTALEPIIFTSIKDDSVGNPADTNGDGAATSPAAGNWDWIYFDEVSDDATAIIDNCELRYGTSSGSYGMVRCNSASPVISNNVFDSASFALSTRGASNPVFANCTVDNMTVAPVLMSLTSDPVFSGNQFLAGNAYNALGIIGETLAQDATIRARDVGQTARIPYLLRGSLTAGFSSILRIEPGVVIKSATTSYSITIQRGLIAEGGSSPDSLIVFTSATDDFYGGDTNTDGGATALDATRWGRIIIQNEAIDDSTRISNAVFRYGYNSSTYGTIEVNSANPEIDNCVFAYNGVAVDYKGVAGDPAQGWIHDSDFISNTYYGVRNQGTAFTVDATNNWWGHATGPLDGSDDTGSGGFYNPGGLGDPVSDRVDYGSWDTDGVQNLVLGDVSRNGDVRAYDASLVLQELVAPGLLGPLQLVLGDVDCTGSLMALDASQILRYVAGLDTYFPCALDSVATKNAGAPPAITTAAPVNFVADLPLVTVAAGQSAWVPVQLDGSGDVFGQEYHIMFDPELVSVTGVRLLPVAEGSSLAWNVIDGHELRIAIASLEPLAVIDAVEFEVTGVSGLTEATPAMLVLGFARLNTEEQLGASGAGDLPDAAATQLFQNQPNPFNPVTTIQFAVGADLADVPVRLTVFDARGHAVRQLLNERRDAGVHAVVWDGRDDSGRQVGSGLYLYRLNVGETVLVNKMLLLK